MLIAICFLPTCFFPERNFYRSSFQSVIFYDPVPEKSYTKAKLQSLQENTENTSPNQGDSDTELFLPQDERADEFFNENFSVLPHFVLSDAFQHATENFRKIVEEVKHVDAVMSSNVKGMGTMQFSFVYNLQVYKEPEEKSYICQTSYQRDRKYKIK